MFSHFTRTQTQSKRKDRQEAQLSLGGSISEGQHLTLGLGKKEIPQTQYSPIHAIIHYGDAALLNAKINDRI